MFPTPGKVYEIQNENCNFFITFPPSTWNNNIPTLNRLTLLMSSLFQRLQTITETICLQWKTLPSENNS